MAFEESSHKSFKPINQINPESGTLSIDLGNSTTVIAFQSEHSETPQLLDLGSINRREGEVPSLVWKSNEDKYSTLIGQEVVKAGLSSSDNPNLNIDFKRWIGSPEGEWSETKTISPEKAGEILIHKIWEEIPCNLDIRRLVLTAPVETYKPYRKWLFNVCNALNVEEIALVDEPTAAALGAGLSPGSKLMVFDFGGSTIDLSVVALEGGEGKADPVAELMRFGGNDLENKSKQVLKSAKVLAKSGLRLGGRDLDRWIANYLFPNNELSEALLNAVERVKCRLSDENIQNDLYIKDNFTTNSKDSSIEIRLCKSALEEVLIENGLLDSLTQLIKKTFASARGNGCEVNDLDAVVTVGGSSLIPLIRKWLKSQIGSTPLLTPPPIQAVAIGALTLTPGVKIKDILTRGIALRCWDQRSSKHFWHPLFLAGQPWPTSNELQIILSASKSNQSEIELILGEPEIEGANEIIYVDGIPTIKEKEDKSEVMPWHKEPCKLELIPNGNPGEDCLKLSFSINNQAQLLMKGIDLRNEREISEKSLGSVR